MNIEQAMRERHSVRKFSDRKIPHDTIKLLNAKIKENNEKYDLKMKLVTDNDKVVKGIVNLTFIKNAVNFIVLSGKDRAGLDELLGYCGADIMLYTQTLGLNTVWLGGTYNKKKALQAGKLSDNERMTGIIVVGFGETQGVPHKSKSASEICSYNGNAPDWFINGVNAVLLAPTAINRQGFFIKGDGNTVEMTCNNGVFSDTDLGIGKYHFEIGAGKDNFTWK